MLHLRPGVAIDIHRLGSDRSQPESVLGILLRDGGPGRLVYGELRGNKYQPLWDSPLYDVWRSGMVYLDLDNDGVKEIILQGMTNGQDKLAALSIRGVEITRQTPRIIESFTDGLEIDGSLCPIVAHTIDLAALPDGGYLIRVVHASTDSRDRTYKVVRGRLVAGPLGLTTGIDVLEVHTP